ncbi:substrate-binding periplasmic protein [Roseateles cellulosilyticus]|uniref:Transporter substrate-binding domain-containing protein n=1 Tax=Pelomonas cellulosilytica TaxID=2906762 RepID=A0ABS8XT33_9BURK|nr:transporter substrate-binding domain-containing protein [Pelomonas sp. P8]MCE4555881.1 transporter substrate-binding domain-containing protein [Pelomonas sp. P8]
MAPSLRRMLVLAVAALLGAGAQAEPGLQWVAGDLPPFASAGDDRPRGYAHDLAMAMAARLGRSIEVQYVPWARAVRMAEQGPDIGIFPLARTPDRETRFQWLLPLMPVRFGIYGRAGAKQLDLPALRQLRVGVLRGSLLTTNLRVAGFVNIVEGKDYRDLLRRLHHGMLDAVYAGTPMLEAAMDDYGQPRNRFMLHTTLGGATLYMAASRDLAADEAERWITAYRQLESDGTVAQLRRRYLH